MAQRSESEQDFGLKAAIRSVLWGQGYTTRVDVLLAYDLDVRGRAATGKAGLTDLDVLGLRLDPGFRIHSTIADCKTSKASAIERLFWLSGVGFFFSSDSNLLVRSHPVLGHAFPLARSLGISIVGPDDLEILTNTYTKGSNKETLQPWQEFFSAKLLSEVLGRLSTLKQVAPPVALYREAQYWMDAPHVRLQRSIAALQQLGREASRGDVARLAFADYVWLYVIALWKACESLSMTGLSRLERGLELYISGGEVGLQNLQRVRRSFEELARRAHADVSLPLLPPYFGGLVELVARVVRRPTAAARMARRAEWLIAGQAVGHLGLPPWTPTDDDVIAEKLLGDVATFLVKSSGLDDSFLHFYVDLLHRPARSGSDSLSPKSADVSLVDVDPQVSGPQADVGEKAGLQASPATQETLNLRLGTDQG